MSESLTGNPELAERGLELRRKVIGSKYVDRKLAEASGNDFSEPLQQLITEVTWGVIWARDGLDHRTRSLLNLAIMTALNRPHQLRLHIRGALQNGVTRDEIAEVLLQTAIYCGVPASLDAFDVTEEVLAELDAEGLDQS
jgi:4-carboxymuconolactone decarboxylase